jgi:hypothetical protein
MGACALVGHAFNLLFDFDTGLYSQNLDQFLGQLEHTKKLRGDNEDFDSSEHYLGYWPINIIWTTIEM